LITNSPAPAKQPQDKRPGPHVGSLTRNRIRQTRSSKPGPYCLQFHRERLVGVFRPCRCAVIGPSIISSQHALTEGTAMQSRLPLREGFMGASQHGLVQADERDFMAELQFLAAWENGRIPSLSAFLRVRQIRRAHPYLTAPDSSVSPTSRHGPVPDRSGTIGI